MGKYNSGKNGKTAKLNTKSLVAEIVALIAIVVLIVTLTLVGANKGGTKTSIFALERDTYVLDGDYQISDLDFDAIGSTENNLRLSHACCIDLNGYVLDLNGYALSIIPTISQGLVTIKNGTIKNGILLIDNDESDLTIDGVNFDSSVKYTLRTSGSIMTICASTVLSRNVKATGGLLKLENAKIDDIDLYSDLNAEGSTIGFITSKLEGLNLYADNCSIAGVKVSSTTTFDGNFDCAVDVMSDATASADGEQQRTTINVNKNVTTINVNTDAIINLKRDGETEYGATVGTLNVNKDNATINVQNCASVGTFNSYANAMINVSGEIGNLRIPSQSTVVGQKSAIVKNMTVVGDATINYNGTIHYAQIEGGATVTFDYDAKFLKVDVMDTSTATINLKCVGAVFVVYGISSHVYVDDKCIIEMIIDHASNNADIQLESPDAEILYYGTDVTDADIERTIKAYDIPIAYIDSTCTGSGFILTAPGADLNAHITDIPLMSIGHKYEYYVIAPATEEQDGKGLRVCTVCGLEYEYTIEKDAPIYDPKTPIDYLALLFGAGEHDYSLRDNSGYVLNYTETEAQSSGDGGTGILYDILYFKTCYIHVDVEQNKETRQTRLFGDVDIDATLLKGYSEEPDWNNIDDTKAQEVITFRLTAALKDSVVAYKYEGPDFLFIRSGEFFMDVNDLLNNYLHQIPVIPESFSVNDIMDVIETVRKIIYYFDKYGEPFEFLFEALTHRVNLSAMVPGITWIMKDPNVENGYYLSFEHLAETIIAFKDMNLSEYIDNVFGRGSVDAILNYADKLPGDKMSDIQESLEAIASMFGGMDVDSLIDDFNILVSILIKNVISELPGDQEVIKENMTKYFGDPFNIRKAFNDYGSYTIYELIYGQYVEDPESEDPAGDKQRYEAARQDFMNAWSNTISTLDTVSLNTSIGTLVDSLLETLEAYIDVVTFEGVLGELGKLDKYFEYRWVTDSSENNKKLNSEFELYIPKGIEIDVIDAVMSGEGYFASVVEYLRNVIYSITGVSSAEEPGDDYIKVFNYKYNDKDGYFTELKFDWLMFDYEEEPEDGVRVTLNLTGVNEVKEYEETTSGIKPFSYYYNTYNINIYEPHGEGEDDDVVLFNVDYDEQTHKISNLDANINIAGVSFIYHDYATYIVCGLGVEQLYDAQLELRLDFADGHLSGDKLVIRDDATPTDVIKDALMMLRELGLTATLSDLYEEPISLEVLTFESDDIVDGKHAVRMNVFPFELFSCAQYVIWFDEDVFYLDGYKCDEFGMNPQTYWHYGIINDEFVKNADGKIRGMNLVGYDMYYRGYGGIYLFDNEYRFIELGFSFEDTIKLHYTNFDDVYTNYTTEMLDDYYSGYKTVVIGDTVYVHAGQLNSDFNPDYNTGNRWRKHWTKMDTVDESRIDAHDVKYIYEKAANVDFKANGEIIYDYKACNKFGANFAVDYLEWAHYTTKVSSYEYNDVAYKDWLRDIDGDLALNIEKVAPPADAEDQRYKYKFVDGNFLYYRYDVQYDNGKEEVYKNWKQDGDKYVLDSYQDEGGEIYYDAEIDELYGKIIETKRNYHWEQIGGYYNSYYTYVTRMKYEILDEKYDQDRRIKLVRYRYEDDETDVIKNTELYGMLDVIFGEEQDALQFTFGSDWLAGIEGELHHWGLTNRSRSSAEIRETGATETYQILAYKNEKGKYNGVALRIYDFEVAFVIDNEEIMLILDLRRFDFPLNVDIDVVIGDITDLSFIVQYGEKGNEEVDVNITGTDEKLDGYVAVYGVKYFTAFRDNVTGEWDYKLMKPILGKDEDFNPKNDYPYYALSFIYKDEDIDFLWGVFNRGNKPEEEKSWLERILDIADHRDIIKANYDKLAKVLKVDFTILALGAVSLNVNLMISDTYYEYSFNLVGPLNEDYQHETAGKESIEIINFLKISGNHQTGAISVYIIDMFTEMAQDVAFLFCYDPFGDNGFSIYRSYEDFEASFNGDNEILGDEYITVMYNLTDYTLRVVLEGMLEAIVEIDDDDPTIRNAHLFVSIINLERDFQITELEDGRIMAVSNIWNYTLGIYEPSTFVIAVTTTEMENYREINANIEKGLGTGAYYVGQIDYKDDGVEKTVFFTIVTQLKIVSNVDIYTKESGNLDEDDNPYVDTYVDVPFTYEGDGLYYDFHIYFKESQDPKSRIIDDGSEDGLTVEQFIDKFFEEVRASQNEK